MVEIEPPFDGDGGFLISGYFRHRTTYYKARFYWTT